MVSKMITLTLLIALLSGGVSGATSRDSNQYIEPLLYISLQNEIRSNRLDPAEMPVFIARTKERLGPIRVTVVADYANGTLSGLSRAYRLGDCAAPEWKYGNISINCSVSYPELTVLYDTQVQYGRMPSASLRPTVKVKANVTFSGAVANLEITGARNGSYPLLRSLVMVSLGKMTVNFKGLGHLNRQLKPLKDGISKHVPAFTLGVFYGPYLYAMNAAVNRTPLPNTIFS